MGPREIAGLVSSRVAAIGKERAKALARTEIIRAHSEGQLDSLEQLGVEQVGVAVELATSGYNVCEKCKKLNKVVLTLAEARGVIPVHPNCKCSWIPANVGEDHRGQKRNYSSIKNAIERSLGKKRISKKRPKEMV